MTAPLDKLQQDTGSIDELYPVAGIDNDSQGFRDNFGYIKDALSQTHDLIDTLQSNAVLKADLLTNATVTNDLAGSVINNGKTIQMAGNALTGIDSAGTFHIDLSQASFYYCTLTEDSTIQFTGWPTWATAGAPALSKVMVQLKAGTGDSVNKVATLSAGAHTITCDSSTAWTSGTNTVTLNATTHKWKALEAWSWDGGLNVFVRFLGEF